MKIKLASFFAGVLALAFAAPLAAQACNGENREADSTDNVPGQTQTSTERNTLSS